MEDELRDLLRRQADRVPHQDQVPRGMLRRARRRVVFTVATGTVVMAAIAFGGYTGVQALTSARALHPATTPTSPGRQFHHGAPLSCRAADLTIASDIQGAAGQRQGSLVFENRSGLACILEGRPGVTFLDAKGKPLQVQIVQTQAWWQVDGKPKPSGWPVVTLHPGEKARIRTSWGNWCGSDLPHTWRITPNGGGSLDVAAPGAPPCLGPGQPSTLEVGPFEPAA